MEQFQPPVCPRHPDTVSYVSCQRCGRPVCPECQRPAAVGVQCVDCVRQATQPRVRRVHHAPVVTYTLIGICVVAFLLQLAVPPFTSWFIDLTPFIPEQPWRLLTAGFLHDDSHVLSMHLILNMLSLWFLGRILEPVLGRWRFACVFLVGVIGGGVAFAYLGHPMDTVLGASGGIFALGGALLVVLRRDKQNLIAMAVILGINLVYGLVVPGVAWEAHVGGLVTGVIMGALYTGGTSSKRTATQAALTVVLAAVLVAAGMYGGELATQRIIVG